MTVGSGAGPNIPDRCWLDPRIEARPSRIEGLGLFATSPISAEEVVGVLGGSVIDDDELAEIAHAREKYNSAAMGEGENILLADDELIARGNGPPLKRWPTVTTPAQQMVPPHGGLFRYTQAGR